MSDDRAILNIRAEKWSEDSGYVIDIYFPASKIEDLQIMENEVEGLCDLVRRLARPVPSNLCCIGQCEKNNCTVHKGITVRLGAGTYSKCPHFDEDPCSMVGLNPICDAHDNNCHKIIPALAAAVEEWRKMGLEVTFV
jgi:hypothetical protein